jgi:hypothetical protein
MYRWSGEITLRLSPPGGSCSRQPLIKCTISRSIPGLSLVRLRNGRPMGCLVKAFLRGRHRWRLLVKSPRELDLQAYQTP